MASCQTCGSEVAAMDVHLVWHDALIAALAAADSTPQ